MQFGVHLPTNWPDYGSHTVQSAIEEIAQTAAVLNYASVWANDTVIVSSENAWAAYVMEPLITLASLVHLVPTLHFGLATLILAQRNAIIVAKQAAALDILSHGRFILGIGAGWRRDEFAYLHADFAHRGSITDESIAVMQTLWHEPVAEYHGRAYDLAGALVYPKPISHPFPLWIGGNSTAAIRRAARVGHAWIPFGIGLDDFRAGVGELRACADEDRHPMIAAELILRIDPAHTHIEAQTLDAPATTHVAGSPDEIVAILSAYQQAGLEYLVTAFEATTVDNLQRQMRLFAEQVAPQLTGGS